MDQSLMTPPPSPKNPNRFRRVWDRLTQTHPSITDLETRRQSRLLAIIAVVVIFTAAINLIGGAPSFIASPTVNGLYGFMAGLFTIVWIGALYAFNRRGHYHTAALGYIALSFLTVHLLALITRENVALLYTPMLLIVSAILMPTRFTVGLFFVGLSAQIVIGSITPTPTRHENLSAFFTFLMTSSLVIAFIVYRNALEKDRRAELEATNRRLRESEAALEQRVEQRVRELQRATQEAEIARVQAEQSDRVKSQFLASMSHELRTPLNAILTFNELMMMGTFGEVNDEQIDYLEKTLSSGRHLLSLINDVLDITKLHSGMMKLFIEDDFNVAAELHNVQVAAEKLLAGKPVQIITDIDANIPPLRCDKRRLRQVMYNLVSNAIKFTDSGTITISAKRRESELLFAVIDTGQGIAPEMQALIFEPFIQTEAGIKQSAGTGLGLPISKSLMEAHGGQLWVESSPGQGSAFYARLPLESPLQLGEHQPDNLSAA